jgi:hypothetical protein
MLFAWLKPKQPQNGEALGFVQALALEAALPFTVLAAPGRNGFEVATFGPRSSELRPWLAKRADQRLFVLTAQASGPLAGRAILEADLVQTRIVTVAVPAAKSRALDAFRPAPAIVAETPKGLVAAWRLRNPTSPAKAQTIAAHIADRIGGAPMGHLFPLPGCGGVRLAQHLKGPGSWALVSDLDGPGAWPASGAAPPFRPSAPAVMLGAQKAGGNVFWAPFENEAKLLNCGVLVTSDPGSGKTQTLNVLIDGVAGMGLPVCIFDFKNDYSERSFVEAIGLKVLDVRRQGLPFNPLMPSFGAEGLAQPIEHIFTIAGVLKRVFGLGDRQAAILRDAMKEAFEQCGVNPQSWVHADACRAPSFDDVTAILGGRGKDKQAAGVLDRLAPLTELGLFPKTGALPVPFETLMDGRIVLSLFALPADDIKAALAELIIIALHGMLVSRQHPRKLTRLLVVDEAHRVASSKHLENLAREGRAFGAGIAIGTQYPGDLPADLSGALGTKIYLKNQHPDHKKAVVAALCGGGSGPAAANLQATLERLSQFEGLIQNQHYLPYAEFKLTPYFMRARQHPKRRAPEGAGEPLRAAAEAPKPVPAVSEPAPASPEPAAPQSRDHATKAAENWLSGRLADGGWHDSGGILPAWHAYRGGVAGEPVKAKDTLYRARRNLGVVTRKQPDSDRHDWRLPKAEESQ